MLPILLAVKSMIHKRSANIPIDKGLWNIKSNKEDSEFEFFLNNISVPVSGDSIEIMEHSIISVQITKAGTEKSLNLFLEKI